MRGTSTVLLIMVAVLMLYLAWRTQIVGNILGVVTPQAGGAIPPASGGASQPATTPPTPPSTVEVIPTDTVPPEDLAI